MWFSRILRLLVTGPPVPLTLTGEPGGAAFRGRYLHIEGLPFGLGRMIGQGDEAMVYELVSLRRGNCGYVVKICRYSPGTARYERWAVPVRDESSPYANVPDIERVPARLLEVPGGLVKIQQYIGNDPATAWATPYPAADVYGHIEHFGPEQAVRLADTLIEKYGPRGVLLEAKAVSLWYGRRQAEAEPVFEAAIEALTTEHNVSRLSATCYLAAMLFENYRNRRPSGSGLVLTLPDGSVHRQFYFATPEEAAADDTEQDRPVLLLLESLAEEPYLVRALSLLAFAISDAPAAGPAMRAIVHAVERIDPGYDSVPQLRQLAEQFGPESPTAGKADGDTNGDAASPIQRPPEADEMMARFDRAYRPDPTRGQQAKGRHLAAQSHLEAGRVDDAERELRAAIMLDHGTLEYRVSLIELLSRSRDRLDEARDFAEQTARAFPDDPAGYESLGHVCVIRGEYEEGLLAFLRALRAEPPEPWRIEVKVGQTYRDLGDIRRAMPFLRAAYEHAPDQPMTAVALAQVLRSDSVDDENPGQDPGFQEAYTILTAAVELNPDSAEALVSLAQSHAALDHPGEARALLRRAVELDPGHPFAADFLAAVERWLAEANNE
jgi:tetratricopeptide (TPR) repeat protein